MIRALGVQKNGKLSLVFGLTKLDMKHLEEGQAITTDLAGMPFPEDDQNLSNITITIIHGEDEAEIKDELRALMAPSSSIN